MEEEKRNYVIYSEFNHEPIERIVVMTETQARAINWFINNFGLIGGVELAENYEGEEI